MLSQKYIDEHISRSGTQLSMLNVVKHLRKIIPKLSTLSSIKVTMLVKFQESVKPEKNSMLIEKAIRI